MIDDQKQELEKVNEGDTHRNEKTGLQTKRYQWRACVRGVRACAASQAELYMM